MRAYSILHIKSLDAERRRFAGIATTPSVDRMGDVVHPTGLTFRNPVTLLWRHDHAQPIGIATLHAPTHAGVEFEAEIPHVREPGPLKDRVDTAWGEVKAGLARAVSIGFRPIKTKPRAQGGIDFLEAEVYELSVVAVPAQAEAVITAVKGLDALPPDVVRLVAAADSPGVRLAFERRPRWL